MNAVVPDTSVWSGVDEGSGDGPGSMALQVGLVDLVWTACGMGIFFVLCYWLKRRHQQKYPDLECGVFPVVEKHNYEDLNFVPSKLSPLPKEKVVKGVGDSLWEEILETVAILLLQEKESGEQNRVCQLEEAVPVSDQNSLRGESSEGSEGEDIMLYQAYTQNILLRGTNQEDSSNDISHSRDSSVEFSPPVASSTGKDMIPFRAATQDVIRGSNEDTSKQMIPFKSDFSPVEWCLPMAQSACKSQPVASSPMRSPKTISEDTFYECDVYLDDMIELEFQKEGDETKLIWK